MNEPMPPSSSQDEKTQENRTDDSPQPLMSHLVELRNRLLHAVVVVMIVFFGLYYFANDLYLFVSEPLRQFLPEGSSMIATGVASPFLTPFKLAFFTALFISMPYILFQLWRFIAPALYQGERRLALPLLFSSICLFYIGIAFAYFIVFPLVFAFLTSAGPSDVTVMTDISLYLDFVIKLFFAFGIAFEIPIAIIIMVTIGVTSTASLSEKRPYLIVACFIVGMLLTPPDVISQTLLAVPMWALFEIGLLLSRFIEKRDESTSA